MRTYPCRPIACVMKTQADQAGAQCKMCPGLSRIDFFAASARPARDRSLARGCVRAVGTPGRGICARVCHVRASRVCARAWAALACMRVSSHVKATN
jgi:hypothetical protein